MRGFFKGAILALLCFSFSLIAPSLEQPASESHTITDSPQPVSNFATGLVPDDSDSTPTPTPTPEAEGYVVPIQMFYQTDPEWADYLYGDSDPMETHGCGPTVLAILVSSLTDTELLPTEAADWATDMGYFYEGSGSAHSLIPEGAMSFGLDVELTGQLTEESIKYIFSQDKLIVMLMGPGDFTNGGHFIVAHGYAPDGSVIIADPVSEDNTNTLWDVEDLVSQLNLNAQNAGPVWIISS